MKKLLFVFGTRPEAIKLAPVILEAKTHQDIQVKVVVTAQHRQMLDQVLKIFDIQPDVDLNLMAPSQSLNEISSKAIASLGKVFESEKPDWVIVHGDTTTTMAATLSAFHQQIPVAHVEAGLRTFNLSSPFPEEMNRQVTGLLSSLHFVPTERARQNLVAERKRDESIHLVGNTVVDSLLWVLDKFKKDPALASQLDQSLPSVDPLKKKIMVTMHRRENFKEGLSSICHGILKVIQERIDVDFIIPLHLNPIVQKTVRDILQSHSQIHIIDPLEYLPFVRLMQSCDVILTDSGGLQEEAPSLNKPVLILRNETERPEAIEAGCAKLVGTDSQMIANEILKLLDKKSETKMTNPFGDGSASKKIIQFFRS